jgi:hypothetical protein
MIHFPFYFLVNYGEFFLVYQYFGTTGSFKRCTFLKFSPFLFSLDSNYLKLCFHKIKEYLLLNKLKNKLFKRIYILHIY